MTRYDHTNDDRRLLDAETWDAPRRMGREDCRHEIGWAPPRAGTVWDDVEEDDL